MTSHKEQPLRLYAHRGVSLIFPENTLPAFACALREQATHLEMDVHCTKEMEVVVSHDPDGKRTANVSKRIAECSLGEVQSWDLSRSLQGATGEDCFIPTFSEVLEKFPAARLNVDIKDNRKEAVEKVVRLLHKRGDANRVLLTSFDSRVLNHLRRIPYLGQTGVSKWGILQILFSPFLAWQWGRKAIPGDALQIPPVWKKLRLDCPYMIRRCHKLGKRVDYWTINDPKEAWRLLELGADGIISDDVIKVREAVIAFAKGSGRRLDYL